MFFSPFSIAITSLEEERANLSAFHTFVRFVLVWICPIPLPLGVWEGLRLVIVALPGLCSYLFFFFFFFFKKLYPHYLPWEGCFLRVWPCSVFQRVNRLNKTASVSFLEVVLYVQRMPFY